MKKISLLQNIVGIVLSGFLVQLAFNTVAGSYAHLGKTLSSVSQFAWRSHAASSIDIILTKKFLRLSI